jgi:hypothetical protein
MRRAMQNAQRVLVTVGMLMVGMIIVPVSVTMLGASLMPVRMLIHKFAFIHAHYL